MSLLWMRQNTKVIFWVLLGSFLLLIFGVWGAQLSLNKTGREETVGAVVAEVYGEEITSGTLSQLVEYQLDQVRQYFQGQLTEDMVQRIRKSALDQLILERLVDEEIERLGIEPLEAEVELRIRSYLSDENNQLDPELVEQANTNRSFAARLQEHAVQSLRQDRLMQWLQECVKVTPAECKARYQLENEKVRIKGVALPSSKFAEDAEADEEEMKAYYEGRREEFERPLRRKISYCLLERETFMEGIEVKEEEIADYYDNHAEDFWSKESVRARQIQINVDPGEEKDAMEAMRSALKRIQDGEPFEEVAKEVSEGPNASSGGDLGTFPRGQYEEIYGQEFVDRCFSLEPGEMSGILETERALHLIEVQERIPEGYAPLSEVREEIEEAVRQEKAADKALSKAWELKEKAEKAGWEALKEEESVEVKETDFFAQTRWVPGLFSFEGLGSLVFDTGVGVVAEPQESDEGALLFTVMEERPKGVAPFEEVREDVEEGVLREMGLRAAKETAETIRKRLLEGASWEESCEDLEGVEAVESEAFSLYGPTGQVRIPNFPGAGIEVAQGAFQLDVGELSEVKEGKNACYLFEVVSHEAPDWERFDVERMSQTILREKQQELRSRWTESLRERADAAGDVKILVEELADQEEG